MAENSLSNGLVRQATARQDLTRDRARRVPDIPATESRNWLLHRHYTRHEYRICKTLIEEEFTRSNGYNEYASCLMGLILRKEGRVRDSLDCFERCYSINPRNVDNVKQIAKSFFLLGSHERAIEAYSEAERMSVVPDWEIYHGLGECHARAGRTNEARDCLRKAADLTKSDTPRVLLAKLYVAGNRISEAISTYTSALESFGRVGHDSEEACVELGLLYLRIGDTRRAFQQFGTVLARSPGCTKALLPMAAIMQSNREHDVALSKYKTAAQFMPESSSLWNNIGMCFYGKQKFVAAISCLKRAHYSNPMELIPACNLGIVFLTIGQPASAAVYLCAAVSAAPDYAMPYLLLGLALKRLGDPEGAEKSLEKAHALAPQDPLVLINFAVVLEASGKAERAAEVLATLNEVAAVLDVDAEIAETSSKLSAKLRRAVAGEGEIAGTGERTLTTDEV